MAIYLDHAATTPMVEACTQAVIRQLKVLGNPSSLHTFGRAARKELERAREIIARHVDCHPSEIIFTGSGTEADNTALKGLFWRGKAHGRNVVVISAIEHHAILDPAQWLTDHEGAEVILLDVDSNGLINLNQVRELLSHRADEIAVISVMSANNETGVIQPISEIVEIASDYGVAVHSDAVQSFGKVPLSFSKLGLTAMTLSGHKIGGPLGIGILVLRKGFDIPALLHGGGQERDIRSGTFNAPSIVGFATAVEEIFLDFVSHSLKVASLRVALESGIAAKMPDAYINGLSADRLPGIVNATFPGTESDTLLLLLDAEGVACSTGSACSAGVQRPSHVLLAMGHTDVSARSSLRFSIGPSNTAEDIAQTLKLLPAVLTRARAANLR
ncbi:MAG: cysteine desulfurase [Actinobacteria bacterium]|nr:cysteine desulfurase [Actinomycetota bacterium]